jgi:hypothetical protein
MANILKTEKKVAAAHQITKERGKSMAKTSRGYFKPRSMPRFAKAYLILRYCGYSHSDLKSVFGIPSTTALRWMKEHYGDEAYFDLFFLKYDGIRPVAKKLTDAIDGILKKSQRDSN